MSLAQAAEFEARCEASEVRPGGLLELELRRTGDAPGKVGWHVPGHSMLQRVAVEEIPIQRLESGRYLSGERWILQAIRSGPIEWIGLEAHYEEEGELVRVPLNPVLLEVRSFSKEALSDEPAPWQESTQDGGRMWWPALVMAVVVGFVTLTMVARKKDPEEGGGSSEAEDPFDWLARKLVEGQLSREELQGFIHQHGSQCSEAFRATMEKAAYAREPDVASLLGKLREEVRR